MTNVIAMDSAALEALTHQELRARFREVLGGEPRSPNRRWMIRQIEKTLADRNAIAAGGVPTNDAASTRADGFVAVPVAIEDAAAAGPPESDASVSGISEVLRDAGDHGSTAVEAVGSGVSDAASTGGDGAPEVAETGSERVGEVALNAAPASRDGVSEIVESGEGDAALNFARAGDDRGAELGREDGEIVGVVASETACPRIDDPSEAAGASVSADAPVVVEVLREDAVAREGAVGGDARVPVPSRPARGRFASMTVAELQALYLQTVGRGTDSEHRGYLTWKIREAEKGRIPLGPRRERTVTPANSEVKIIPLRLADLAVVALDGVRQRKGYGSRMALFRAALHEFLIRSGEPGAAAHFAVAGTARGQDASPPREGEGAR